MFSKRLFEIMLCLVLGVALLFTVSCAKKQVAVSDATGVKSGVADDSADRAREAERARMMELERAQRLAQQQVEAFQNERIYFDFDRSDLRSEAKVILQKKAEWLRSNTEYRLVVEGHCDERGTNEYNLALGDRRANTTKDYLVALGVDDMRISTISYGEEKPLDPGHSEGAWSQNRRAEFRLSK
ncbi:peptidoglycan-associated lipoprotein Pal [Desulfatiglans anilini]|uniref:peptidoglycan-associated lipoprotein Pal n=1 Tax=Desulfatiglans anilini TaxID=90728 RepID=UPI0003FD3932|nr:peptidoglycan-associated lipoprotein Pal [Desulfatiglans anilini]